ncbi:hypothetical protein SDC9_79473 [bioreactor metagenome]|uniref:Uncharacterized protein n=1 Tax=bioreactor metagenome TaxID=1076179 RepID=A0A644YWI6_9ZZZZ
MPAAADDKGRRRLGNFDIEPSGESAAKPRVLIRRDVVILLKIGTPAGECLAGVPKRLPFIRAAADGPIGAPVPEEQHFFADCGGRRPLAFDNVE